MKKSISRTTKSTFDYKIDYEKVDYTQLTLMFHRIQPLLLLGRWLLSSFNLGRTKMLTVILKICRKSICRTLIGFCRKSIYRSLIENNFWHTADSDVSPYLVIVVVVGQIICIFDYRIMISFNLDRTKM